MNTLYGGMGTHGRLHRRNEGWRFSVALFVLAAASGCSSNDEGNKIEEPVTGAGGSAGSGGGVVFEPPPGSGGANGQTDGGTGATGAGGGTTDPLMSCGNTIEGLMGCNTQTVGAQIRRPNMLIVMDKSTSMVDQPEGFETPIWDAAKTALAASLTAVQDRISMGLELYPFPADGVTTIPEECMDRCCEMPTDAEMNVPIEDGVTAVPKILSALDATGPGGGTPTAAALRRAVEYFTTGHGATLDGEKFVLLVTDGGPNCNAGLTCGEDKCTANLEDQCSAGTNCCEGFAISCVDDADTNAAIAELAAAGVYTYVMGIPGSQFYSDYLNGFAVTGQRPNPDGPDSYYRVDAAGGVEGLTAVFNAITTQLVTSCELELETPPPDPEKVNVAVDCKVIPSEGTDGTDGWVLDMSSDPQKVVLQGTLCRWVQETGAQRVDIVFGCPKVR